jgi:hypothetical protein
MMKSNAIYTGLYAISQRLNTNERRARWLVAEGYLRIVKIGRCHTETEAMLEAYVAAIEARQQRRATSS